MIIKSRHLFTFFFLIFIGLTLPVHALKADNDEQSQQSVYHIYSGGFHFVTGTFFYDYGGKGYKASFKAAPHGFLGKLLPWKAYLAVDGKISKDHLIPSTFVNATTWRNNIKTATLGYDTKGNLTKFTENTPKRGLIEKKINKELADKTVDVLTTVMTILFEKGEQACGNSYPVFDGKRRFDVKLSSPINVTLEKSSYNIFEGAALQCNMELEPIAGFKKKRGWYAVEEQSKKNEMIPTIWLGKRPGKDHYELIKAHIKTDYGSVLLHLAE